MRIFPVAASVVAAGVLMLAVPTAVQAEVDAANPCNVQGWFVNPDEADRAPERTTAGFVFEDADLIHHNAPEGLTTKDLNNGAYNAAPNPDQGSFFSVEVSGDDGGYATLRWNPTNVEWEMTTGGMFYKHADPDILVDMPPVKRSHKVVRFGVGYTKNPPGTVKTTVKSVSFEGKVYWFKCLKPIDPSPKPSPSQTSSSPTASASPSSTPSSSGSPTSTGSATSTPSATISASSSQSPDPIPSDAGNDDDELPVTGASISTLIGVAVGVILVGGAITVGVRRRKA